jgi:dTDP-4-amino-4,6-dideoxygalactose transaminase
MQFIDLAAQQSRIRETIETNVNAVLNHGRYIMGPEVGELETSLSEFAGVNHAISCASGTDALLLALMAHDVGPGDAIFTTPFTFIATAEVISLLGATPVFVDIDPSTFNMDPEKLKMAISALQADDAKQHPLPKPSELAAKGIIAVDLFGLPADYRRINTIAKQHNLFVIEDAAQSFGAEYFNKRSCSLADVACTSFFPAKPLGGYGDGGMCFTDDQVLADTLKSLRIHGKGGHKYDNVRIGVNGRLDTLQAAILKAKFDIFPDEITLRQAAADRYNAMLSPGGSNKTTCQLPETPADHKSVWAQYSLLAKDNKHRSDLQEKLKAAGVPTAVYYPLPLHLQTAFEHLNYRKGSFPISEDFSKRIFSLPMHPYLQSEDQQQIADIILS